MKPPRSRKGWADVFMGRLRWLSSRKQHYTTCPVMIVPLVVYRAEQDVIRMVEAWRAARPWGPRPIADQEKNIIEAYAALDAAKDGKV